MGSLGILLLKQGTAQGAQPPKAPAHVGPVTRAQVLGRGHFEASQTTWSNDLGVLAAKYRYCPRLEAKVLVNLLGAWSIADVVLSGNLTKQLAEWGAQDLNDFERECLQIVYDSGCIMDVAGFLADSGILRWPPLKWGETGYRRLPNWSLTIMQRHFAERGRPLPVDASYYSAAKLLEESGERTGELPPTQGNYDPKKKCPRDYFRRGLVIRGVAHQQEGELICVDAGYRHA